ncbi:MAG: M13 family metallopeptidase [Kofleriaceae bacterium]
MRIGCCALAFILACSGGNTATKPTPPAPGSDAVATPDPTPPVPSKPIVNRSLVSTGLDPDALDRKVDPCDDFYQFSCGGWIAKTEIPPDKSIAMRSFVDIEDRNTDYLHDMLEKLRAKPGADPAQKQIAAYYGACMDEPAIERQGLAPIAAMRGWIAQVKDVKSLSAAVGRLHAAGIQTLFGMFPTQDSGNAQNVIIGMTQGGLGLPDRDYYLKDEPQAKSLREKYEVYVQALLADLGDRSAKANAAAVLALETEIAKVSKDRVALRDPKATYNKIDKAGVAKAMPSFDWTTYWNLANLAKLDGVDVAVPTFFEGLEKLLATTKPEIWRAYLTFHVGSHATPFLTKKLRDSQFKFEQSITGQPEQQARWKICVAATDGALADLVGQVFVHDRFAGDSKTAAEAYVKAISAAMAANLDQLAWMDAKTKAKAHDKLKAMAYQIGYPKKWRTYAYKVDTKTYAANAFASATSERARSIAKVGKPVDREDWNLSATTVNAYYNPNLNSMMFPAGILQTPFYNVESSVPANLGAMGMVVGHELTHGFDDQGAQYDPVGNLTNWWQPETEKQFKQRTQCVIDQYNKYEVGTAKVNGANTVGENIADIGGAKLALSAYRQLRASAPETVVADGFTEDQQFFLAFGQVWCAKLRPELENLLATTDEHSPSRWRINGTLAALPEFAKAFSCKAGAKLAPAKACTVW